MNALAAVEFHEVRGAPWEVALCRLVEAAWQEGHRAYVWAASEAGARALDDLLWTFREESFVPHGLWQGEPGFDDPVAVGWRPGGPPGCGVLFLARDASPDEVGGFDRVVDLVPTGDPGLTDAARRRYRAFQRAGLAVTFCPAAA